MLNGGSGDVIGGLGRIWILKLLLSSARAPYAGIHTKCARLLCSLHLLQVCLAHLAWTVGARFVGC